MLKHTSRILTLLPPMLFSLGLMAQGDGSGMSGMNMPNDSNSTTTEMPSMPPLVVNMGALFPGGDDAATGDEIWAGLAKGIADFNERHGAMLSIPVSHQKRTTGPADALNDFNCLVAGQGSDCDISGERNMDGPTNFVLGGFASANLLEVVSSGNIANALILSCCSTSPDSDLRQDDTLFRMQPDDRQQAAYLAAQMRAAGITHAVPVYRGDTFGTELRNWFETSFERSGGTLIEMPENPENSGQFSSTSLAAELDSVLMRLETNISEALSMTPPTATNGTNSSTNTTMASPTSATNTVAVVIFGFGSDVAAIMAAANNSNHNTLKEVRWFGVDTPQNVIDNKNARAFAQRAAVSYQALISAPNRSATMVNDQSFRDIECAIQMLAGRQPTQHAFATYDSVQVIGRAIMLAGNTTVGEVQEELPRALCEFINDGGGMFVRNFNDEPFDCAADDLSGLMDNFNAVGDLNRVTMATVQMPNDPGFELWHISNNVWTRLMRNDEGVLVDAPASEPCPTMPPTGSSTATIGDILTVITGLFASILATVW